MWYGLTFNDEAKHVCDDDTDLSDEDENRDAEQQDAEQQDNPWKLSKDEISLYEDIFPQTTTDEKGDTNKVRAYPPSSLIP